MKATITEIAPQDIMTRGFNVEFEDGFIVNLYFDSKESVTEDWVLINANERRDMRLRSYSFEENTKRGYYKN